MMNAKAQVRTPSLGSRMLSLRAACLLLLLSIVIFAAGAFIVQKTDLRKHIQRMTWFHIREVRIAAGWPIDEAMVRSWLPPLEKESLLLLDPAKLVTLLQEKSWVEAVAIKKEYPGRLFIDVRARRPRAVLVSKGHAHFIDSDARTIERVTPQQLRQLDLPVLSSEKELSTTPWDVRRMLGVLDGLQRSADSSLRVSEMSLGSYPVFRVFLASPKIEVTFSLDNWESQLPLLLRLLDDPPSQVQQPRRINLIFPKKAVVSSSLSH